jgi:hypothetical protein
MENLWNSPIDVDFGVAFHRVSAKVGALLDP